ncbi:autotransporter outer membrane beta-barrel domain-containing protein [Brucella anthropi]|uniref:autotransporter outer membrane beta-barrel domain-containing protein n=1 Tax=Brucella anthropi TaxID=529 RepID=UPI002104DBCA|nr:autotransporter outer membrane beta-barrel domain-containing protein [Brucella anthropi]
MSPGSRRPPTDKKPGTGVYVDAVVKQDWLDFGVSAKSVSGFNLSNGYKGKATTASIETGYGFDLGNNVVLQPSAQLTWSKVKADSFTDPYCIPVHGQEAQSLIGRLGVRLEKTFYFGDETVTTYADANVKRGFKGENGLVASNTGIANDMSGTNYDIGSGAVFRVSENVSLFGRAAVEFGGSTNVAGKGTGGLNINW